MAPPILLAIHALPPPTLGANLYYVTAWYVAILWFVRSLATAAIDRTPPHPPVEYTPPEHDPAFFECTPMPQRVLTVATILSVRSIIVITVCVPLASTYGILAAGLIVGLLVSLHHMLHMSLLFRGFNPVRLVVTGLSTTAEFVACTWAVVSCLTVPVRS
jgi:hypothetical protein